MAFSLIRVSHVHIWTVRKGCRRVLKNNDEVALSYTVNKAFVYLDTIVSQEENDKLPEQLRKKYTLSKLLGSGAYGDVYIAFSKDLEKFAIKKIFKKNVGSIKESKKRLNEVNIMKALEHPCIVKVVDVIDSEDIFIVLELMEGGEFYDRIVKDKCLEEPIAKLMFYQIVCGVKYLHDQGITHKDSFEKTINTYDELAVPEKCHNWWQRRCELTPGGTLSLNRWQR